MFDNCLFFMKEHDRCRFFSMPSALKWENHSFLRTAETADYLVFTDKKVETQKASKERTSAGVIPTV